jgi:hypothetical protein
MGDVQALTHQAQDVQAPWAKGAIFGAWRTLKLGCSFGEIEVILPDIFSTHLAMISKTFW